MTVKKYEIQFAKPYLFEGKEYPKIDLSGLEDLTSNDLFEASRLMAMDYISPRPEADPKFCSMIAARVCKLPHEFFNGLPLKEGVKVRDTVFGFFQSEG